MPGIPAHRRCRPHRPGLPPLSRPRDRGQRGAGRQRGGIATGSGTHSPATSRHKATGMTRRDKSGCCRRRRTGRAGRGTTSPRRVTSVTVPARPGTHSNAVESRRRSRVRSHSAYRTVRCRTPVSHTPSSSTPCSRGLLITYLSGSPRPSSGARESTRAKPGNWTYHNNCTQITDRRLTGHDRRLTGYDCGAG